MIATTTGRFASQSGSGVMNGVTALSIRKMASAASAMRFARASRAIEESTPAWWVVTCMIQVATNAADRDSRDVIADRLITVSMAAMTAFCLLRQRNLESQPNERGQCATEAERHCDHGRLHDPLGDFAPPSQMSEVALRLDRLGPKRLT
jgi:hypothetical protein